MGHLRCLGIHTLEAELLLYSLLPLGIVLLLFAILSENDDTMLTRTSTRVRCRRTASQLVVEEEKLCPCPPIRPPPHLLPLPLHFIQR